MNKVGIGTRVLNFMVDTLVVFLITYVVFKIRNWYVVYYHVRYFSFIWFFMGILFMYYSLLEIAFNRTPGKYLSFSKVVDQHGHKPTVGAILLRSLVRLILVDMFFIPFLDKPLHDYISKTELVEA